MDESALSRRLLIAYARYAAVSTSVRTIKGALNRYGLRNESANEEAVEGAKKEDKKKRKAVKLGYDCNRSGVCVTISAGNYIESVTRTRRKSLLSDRCRFERYFSTNYVPC